MPDNEHFFNDWTKFTCVHQYSSLRQGIWEMSSAHRFILASSVERYTRTEFLSICPNISEMSGNGVPDCKSRDAKVRR